MAATKMAIRRIRIDYTVYPPEHRPGEPCWDFRTFVRAKSAARSFGVGARVYRNFNQTNKRNKVLGDWWRDKYFWIWSGKRFERMFDTKRFAGTDENRN
jgi:hypothetical protein